MSEEISGKPVSKRFGVWAVVKHMYGYDVYHAPESLEPKSLPQSAIDRTLIQGRTWLGYRPALAAAKGLYEAFPEFDRSIEQLREIKLFLEGRM